MRRALCGPQRPGHPLDLLRPPRHRRSPEALDATPTGPRRSGRPRAGVGGAGPTLRENAIRIAVEIAVEFCPCRENDLAALEWMGLHTPDRPFIDAAFAAQKRGEALMLLGGSRGFPLAQACVDLADRGTPDRPHLWAARVFPRCRAWALDGRGWRRRSAGPRPWVRGRSNSGSSPPTPAHGVSTSGWATRRPGSGARPSATAGRRGGPRDPQQVILRKALRAQRRPLLGR